SLAPVIPRRLIFLADDPTAQDPRVLGLVRSYCQVDWVACSLGEFCEATERFESKAHSKIQVKSSVAAPFDSSILLKADDQITFVPHGMTGISPTENKHRLLDILFSPTNLDWSPYAANLDFKRDIASTVETAIAAHFEQS